MSKSPRCMKPNTGSIDLDVLALRLEAGEVYYGSQKLDGVRCLFFRGKGYTPSGLEVNNEQVRKFAATLNPSAYYDCEIMPQDSGVSFNELSGISRAENNSMPLKYIVHDLYHRDLPFHERLKWLEHFVAKEEKPELEILPQKQLFTRQDLDAFVVDMYDECEELEGLMFRNRHGFYKNGRSTEKEGLLLRYKPRVTSTVKVTGYTQMCLTKAGVTPRRSPLGFRLPTNKLEDRILVDRIGSLQGIDIDTGLPVSVGTGFSMADRLDIWKVRDSIVGRHLDYSFLDVGVKDRARQASFVRWRKDLDV